MPIESLSWALLGLGWVVTISLGLGVAIRPTYGLPWVPQKVTLSPQKVKKKVKKINNFFFWGSFCYKNVDKMFYQPQKVIFSPQKVQIFFFYFSHIV